MVPYKRRELVNLFPDFSQDSIAEGQNPAIECELREYSQSCRLSIAVPKYLCGRWANENTQLGKFWALYPFPIKVEQWEEYSSKYLEEVREWAKPIINWIKEGGLEVRCNESTTYQDAGDLLIIHVQGLRLVVENAIELKKALLGVKPKVEVKSNIYF
jgi:hypothetical protein